MKMRILASWSTIALLVGLILLAIGLGGWGCAGASDTATVC